MNAYTTPAGLNNPWLTVPEIAEHTRLHADTIRDALNTGELVGIRVSPRLPRSPWRAQLSDVDCWMRAKSGKRRHLR